jgi:membrane protease YdiL (CAAX protease family)
MLTDLTDAMVDLTESKLPVRRFQARTITIPLLFISIHFVMVNIVSIAYLMVLLLLKSITGTVDVMDILGNTDALNQLAQTHYPVITILYSLVLIPVYGAYLHYSHRRDARSLLLERVRILDILPGLAMAIGALGLTTLYFALLAKLAETSTFIAEQLDAYKKLSESFSPENGLIFLIIGISIMAPITEELLFRGVVQGEFRKAMPEPVAIVLQAVIFAFYHLQPVQISYALIPGLLLGMAYAWSRSIWVPILMHMLFNFLGSVLPILVGDDAMLNQIVATAQIAFIAAGLVAAIFFYMNRRRGPIISTKTGRLQS